MRTNISWAFAGNAGYAACQWAVFVLLVRAFEPADVGRFAYAVALTGPVFVLANLRLRNLVATGVRSPHDFRDFLAARLLTTAAATGASLLIASRAADAVTFTIAALVALGKACEAVSDICHGLFQRELNMRAGAIGLLANGIASVLLVGLSVIVRPSLAAATAAYAIGSAVALVGWDLPRSRAMAAAPRIPATVAATLRAVGALVRRAMPLGLSAAVGSLQTNVPRYAVAAQLGPAALAVFTALSYVPTLGNLIANAVAQAALPLLAKDVQASHPQFRRRLFRLVLSGLALGLAGIAAAALAGRELLTIIYGAAYAEHTAALIWLMTAAAVSYAFVFLGTATTARMRFGAQFLTSCAGLLTIAASVGPLVSHRGLAGAAGALVAGGLVQAAVYAYLTVQDLRADARRHGSAAGMAAEPAPLVNCHG